jgi:hypothetical protein
MAPARCAAPSMPSCTRSQPFSHPYSLQGRMVNAMIVIRDSTAEFLLSDMWINVTGLPRLFAG